MNKVEHIGIAVHSAEKAAAFYTETLGMVLKEIIDIPDREIKAAMIDCGNVCLELIEPWENNEKINRFLEKRGEGIHHIAYQVDDIEASIKKLQAQGVTFVTQSPMVGAHGRRIIFIAPQNAHGVLIELCEGSH